MSKYEREFINRIKIVIWDLDETFWQGTVDNGDNISIPDTHIQLIKDLTDKGVINTICSKNSKETVMPILDQYGLSDIFVCPSIDWSNKGNRIKDLLNVLGLRAENALFIDDNHLNREEAEYVLPSLMVGGTECIQWLIDTVGVSGLKEDLSHKRLKQYKVIEAKIKEEKNFQSNTDFLISCNIQVEIHTDCIDEIDRIHELVLRSNQLNYTKIRSTKEEIKSILLDSDIQCGTVHVHDRFGDYGMVGFFAVKEKRAIHFLFSCRTIGMGVEQYVYHILGCPHIQIVGEVISPLNSNESLQWINLKPNQLDETKAEERASVTHRVLLKGPCDMEQIYNFINGADLVDSEFTHVNVNTGVNIQSINHTAHIVQSFELSDSEKNTVIDELPFSSDDFYQTDMFSGKYDVIFLSTVHDAHFGLYRRKNGGQKVAFGEAAYDLTKKENFKKYISGEVYNADCHFTEKSLEFFADEYEFLGAISAIEFEENIVKILRHLPEKTKLVLLLGSEIPCEKDNNPAFAGVHVVHARNNAIIRKLAKEYEQLDYIYFGDYIHSQNDYYINIYHYTASVYYEVAKKICKMIEEWCDNSMEPVSENKVRIARIKQIVRGNVCVSKCIDLLKKIPLVQSIIIKRDANNNKKIK